MEDDTLDTPDTFLEAMRTLMREAGFTVYRAFIPAEDLDNPDACVEALIMARSVDMLDRAALDVLQTKTRSVN
jgi:hypothetical protein